MTTLEFNPPRTIQADWPEHRSELENIRQACALNSDASEDENAIHFLTYNGEQAVACASVSSTQQIYHFAVLPEFANQGNDEALMRFLLMEVPKSGITFLTVEPPLFLQDFYQQFEFQKDTTDDEQSSLLVLRLPPDRSNVHSGSELISLENVDDFRRQYIELIQSSTKRLAVFTLDLEPALFDSPELIEKLVAFQKSSRYAEVRILVKDTQALLQRGSAVLRLYQRSHTQLHIKKLTVNPDSFASAYLLSDDKGIIFRKDEAFYQGVCYLDNRGRVRTQLEEFDQLWNSAVTDPELQRLSV